jgi:hypothetical protein
VLFSFEAAAFRAKLLSSLASCSIRRSMVEIEEHAVYFRMYPGLDTRPDFGCPALGGAILEALHGQFGNRL